MAFTLAKRPLETMEPEAHRIGTRYELLKCVSKTFTVVGMDGPDDDRPTIPQFFRCLIFTSFHSHPEVKTRPVPCNLLNP
jgi:hypothetical protein